MYSTCIFCSAGLGRNEVIEAFPVGQSLAFDAWKGRLWAICPSCKRWNLAPLEERWEAVESAERCFTDTSLRVQSENIGLARLPDGTRLIRVGEALPGEIAAWRYGNQLRRRRWRYWLQTAVMVSVGTVTGAPLLPGHLGRNATVACLSPVESLRGRALRVRLKELHRGEFRVHALTDELQVRFEVRRGILWHRYTVERTGLEARSLLDRVLIRVNQTGAGEHRLGQALHLLERAGSAAAFVRGLGIDPVASRHPPGGEVLRVRERWHGGWTADSPSRETARSRSWSSTRPVGPARMLALEMALQDEVERRALDGEMEELKIRWREAELIAGIADGLLDEPDSPDSASV